MPFKFKTKPMPRAPPADDAKSRPDPPSSIMRDVSEGHVEDKNMVTIRNLHNDRRLVNDAPDGVTIVVEDVDNSRLLFPICARVVHLRRVRNSTLVFLPVDTSILMDGCTDVELVAAAQQLRVHSSNRLALFVHSMTAVIIEECADVGVAPYHLDADSLARFSQRLSESSESGEEDKWRDERRSIASYAPDASAWNECAEPRDFECVVGVSPNWTRLDVTRWKMFSVTNFETE